MVADGRHSVPTRLVVSNETGEERTVDVPAVADAETLGAAAPAAVEFPALEGREFTIGIAGIREVVTHEWYCECDQVMPAGIAEVGIPDLDPIRVAATIPSECRDDLVRLDGGAIRARVVGRSDAALALEPLRVEQCDGSGRPAVDLGAGSHLVTTSRGDRTGWNVDELVLASDAQGAPAGLGNGAAVVVATASASAGPTVRVIDQGRASIRAEVTEASAPFWLVLGQSQNAGWRATVDGRDLGPSTLVNGFANGWLVRPRGSGPMSVTLDWEPQRTVNLALGITVAGLVAAAGVIVTAGVRRRRERVRATAISPVRPDLVRRDLDGHDLARAGTEARAGVADARPGPRPPPLDRDGGARRSVRGVRRRADRGCRDRGRHLRGHPQPARAGGGPGRAGSGVGRLRCVHRGEADLRPIPVGVRVADLLQRDPDAGLDGGRVARGGHAPRRFR